MRQALSRFLAVYSTSYRYLKLAAAAERKHGCLPLAHLRELKQKWAEEILAICRIVVDVRGKVPDSRGLILVGNHISYLDIPLLMSSVDVSFVAKAEIRRWPAIGAGARRTETVLVDRKSSGSRRDAAKAIADAVVSQGRNVAIFPSGTTAIQEHMEWRPGALKIAKDHSLQVQPFRVWYDPVRPAAYIDRDVFPVHLLNLQAKRGRKIAAVIEFGEPTTITDVGADAKRLRDWCNDPEFRQSIASDQG